MLGISRDGWSPDDGSSTLACPVRSGPASRQPVQRSVGSGQSQSINNSLCQPWPCGIRVMCAGCVWGRPCRDFDCHDFRRHSSNMGTRGYLGPGSGPAEAVGIPLSA